MSSIATDPNLAANVSSTTDSNDSTTYITLESLMEELPAFPPFLGFGQNPNPPNSKLPDWTYLENRIDREHLLQDNYLQHIGEKWRLRNVQYHNTFGEDLINHFKYSKLPSAEVETIKKDWEFFQRLKSHSGHFENRKFNIILLLHEFLPIIVSSVQSFLFPSNEYFMPQFRWCSGVAECDLIFDSCSVENGCPSEDRPAVLTVEAGEYTPGHPSIVEYLHSYISSVKGISLEPRIQQNPIVTRLQAPPPKSDKDNLLVDSDLTASGLHLPFNELQNPEQADPRVIRLFHKLWLQLAARNLTFGIFTNYNQTVFLLRHRCSNTLYISRLITILEKELIVAFACLLRAAIDDHRVTQRQQTCGKWDFREELLQTEERNENILLVAGNQNKVEPGCKDQFPSIKAPAEFPTGFFGTYVDPDVDG